MRRQAGGLGGGSSAAALAKQREQEAEADQARKRFGNAKSISSAQFNSNEDSNAVDYEKQVCRVLDQHSEAHDEWHHGRAAVHLRSLQISSVLYL